MKVCGIMIAKENSNRFPGKNHELFENNLDILIGLCGNNDTFIFTNDIIIEKICKNKQKNILIYDRGPNCIDDNQPYLDVLKYAYMSIYRTYDYIVTILANTINHNENIVEELKLKLSMMELNKEITLMRSYNSANQQSGIFIFRTSNLPEKLYHEEMIYDRGSEIHYREELG